MNIGLDSKFYKFANILYNIMMINFFILLGYFSIIFLGGFQATSDYICRKIITKESYELRSTFKKYFYSNFKKTFAVSIVQVPSSVIGSKLLLQEKKIGNIISIANILNEFFSIEIDI